MWKKKHFLNREVNDETEYMRCDFENKDHVVDPHWIIISGDPKENTRLKSSLRLGSKCNLPVLWDYITGFNHPLTDLWDNYQYSLYLPA